VSPAPVSLYIYYRIAASYAADARVEVEGLIDALTRQLAALSERLQEAEAAAPGAANEPPPHY